MTQKEAQFIEKVWSFYTDNKRNNLPWRKTRDPYRIIVSEIMLQQTQVERVVTKYNTFLRKFPSWAVLKEASLGDVLREWQGLGYNRRAKMLHECAKEIFIKWEGVTPKSFEDLRTLPGIGPYTAGAVMAFSYNMPIPVLETNIRTVYLYHFFKHHKTVDDKDLMKFVERTLDKENPREWYWALMDYGAHLKKEHGNQNKKSKQYTKQSRFEGSNRQVRGAILTLLSKKKHSISEILSTLKFEEKKLRAQMENLQKEALIERVQGKYRLPT